MREQEFSRQHLQLEDMPRDSRGVLWVTLLESPEELARIIETEASKLNAEGVVISEKGLRDVDLDSLRYAIKRYYPGSFSELRDKINATTRRRDGFRDPTQIMEEARGFFLEHGQITQKLLYEHKRSDLKHAIASYFPGGMRTVKQALAINPQRPDGFWSEKQIEQEAGEFYKTFGSLTPKNLNADGKSYLVAAINRHYPGRFPALRRNLGLQAEKKVIGYWTLETIEIEARDFFKTYGDLSHPILAEHQRGDLRNAISKKYPEGITALKGQLKIKLSRRIPNFWTPEEIEKEASRFYEDFGRLDTRSLSANGQRSLALAIQRKYPGKLSALQEKLGLRLQNHGRNLLQAYEEELSQGQATSFEEFVKS